MYDAERAVDVADGATQRRGPVDQEQHRPLGRQPARHQVVEQRRRDRRRLGRTFTQAEDVFAPRGVDPPTR